MRSTFLGIEMGRRAVMAQQAALDVTGHNISNANTPGYSRQVAEMVSTDPFTYPAKIMPTSAGQVGTGAVVQDIRRMRDEFVDNQIRNENHRSGYWTSIQDNMEIVEGIINEPSETGLREVMDEYWKAWQALTESPESEAVRGALIEKSQAVVDTFQHSYKQLTDLRSGLNDQVKIKVDDINSIASQIRDLNQQIQAITVSGQRPNDLMDKRDELIEQLSSVANTEVKNEANNMVTVLIGGTALVNGISCNRMGVIGDDNGLYKLVWDLPNNNPNSSLINRNNLEDDINYPEVNISSGELLGIIEARGPADSSSLGKNKFFANDTYGIVPGMITDLNNLALTLIKETNALHKEGYTLKRDASHPDGKFGYSFFNEDLLGGGSDGTIADGIADYEQTFAAPINWAEVISINEQLSTDVKYIAAAAKPTYKEVPAGSGTWVKESLGEGGQALLIAQIKHSLTMGGDPPTITMDDFWRSEASVAGVISQEAQEMVTNQEALILTLDNKRQQTCGVSLDEEMTNMIKFQHAYNAAARFITAADEALDKIINGMGVVGR